MNDRKKQTGKIAAGEKAGNKPCDGCCDRCHKIPDGVYVTPFFLSRQAAGQEKGWSVSVWQGGHHPPMSGLHHRKWWAIPTLPS